MGRVGAFTSPNPGGVRIRNCVSKSMSGIPNELCTREGDVRIRIKSCVLLNLFINNSIFLGAVVVSYSHPPARSKVLDRDGRHWCALSPIVAGGHGNNKNFESCSSASGSVCPLRNPTQIDPVSRRGRHYKGESGAANQMKHLSVFLVKQKSG